MIVYRLARAKYRNDLSGIGAQLAGGRWNSAGIAVLYTAESRALAALEVAVHIQLEAVPDDYFIITIEVPDDIDIKIITEDDLPPNWRSFPEISFTQLIGDSVFKSGKYMALKVPSAIVEDDYNLLFYPKHKDFAKVRVISSKKFEFDQRLFIKN